MPRLPVKDFYYLALTINESHLLQYEVLEILGQARFLLENKYKSKKLSLFGSSPSPEVFASAPQFLFYLSQCENIDLLFTFVHKKP